MAKNVEQLMEEKIRPFIRSHHGDIRILEMHEDGMTIRYFGNCAECPSAELGTRLYIERTLNEELGKPFHVEVADTVSDDLLEMARKILFKDKKIETVQA